MNKASWQVKNAEIDIWLDVDVPPGEGKLDDLHAIALQWLETTIQGRPFILDDFGPRSRRDESWHETYAKAAGMPFVTVKAGRTPLIMLGCTDSGILEKHLEANSLSWISGLTIHVFATVEGMLEQLAAWRANPVLEKTPQPSGALVTLQILADANCIRIRPYGQTVDQCLLDAGTIAHKLNLTWQPL